MADGDGGIGCPLHGTKFFGKADRICSACTKANHSVRGNRKPQRKREPAIRDAEEFPGIPELASQQQITDWLQRIVDDPVRLAAFMADARRPRGTPKARYGVAIRSAIREPMLTADPKAIRAALMRKLPEQGRKPKGPLYKRVLVKPASSKAAQEFGGGWLTREWLVYQLKYAKGLVLVTDRGDESEVFPGWGSMRKAIEAVGMEVVR